MLFCLCFFYCKYRTGIRCRPTVVGQYRDHESIRWTMVETVELPTICEAMCRTFRVLLASPEKRGKCFEDDREN